MRTKSPSIALFLPILILLALPVQAQETDRGDLLIQNATVITVTNGDRDEIIPYDLGLRLFEAAPEPKAFETLRGAGHNDTVQVGGPSYLERIRRFLDEVAPAEAATSSR